MRHFEREESPTHVFLISSVHHNCSQVASDVQESAADGRQRSSDARFDEARRLWSYLSSRSRDLALKARVVFRHNPF